ncbi:MAG: VOC family protein [Alphaproteobacteria bacterium]|nr:VOC family protein [Alphaproteobacteria bacterium]
MNPTPPGWPRVSSSVFYDDAGAAIDFLCDAFGFEVRLRVDGEGGRVEHSELTFGDDGLVMVGTSRVASERAPAPMTSPRNTRGQVTQALCVFVDDVDAHCARARAAGARIQDEPETHDYGADYWADRTYRAIDPEGHHWWFMQRVRGAGA